MKLNAHVKPNRTKPDGPNPTVVSTTQQSHGKNYNLLILLLVVQKYQLPENLLVFLLERLFNLI